MRKFCIAIISLVLALACAFLAPVNISHAFEEDCVSNNVYIGATNVSGMNESQLNDFLGTQVEQYNNVTFTFVSAEDKSISVLGADLGLSIADNDLVSDVLNYGKKGTPLERFMAKKNAMSGNTKVFDFTVKADSEAVRTILEENVDALSQPAVNDGLERVDGEFIYHEGATGIAIDVNASTQSICDYVSETWNGTDAEIHLVTIIDEPEGGTDELSYVKDVLATFTTDYSTSSANRCQNVANATRLLNGTILYPGEEFSVATAINPMTPENGYALAGSYENGKTVETYGGGICQVSTTLYNAVIRAELEVVTRYNHSMIVGYVKPSCDAAISGFVKDFVFKNNLEHPIFIEGYTHDKQVTFNIYGCETRDPGREVVFESETLETTPATNAVSLLGDQPIGYVHTESGHNGVKARLWKIVKENGVEVSRDLFNSSNYMMSPKTVYIGVAGAGPEITNQLAAYAAAGDADTCRAIVAGLTPQ